MGNHAETMTETVVETLLELFLGEIRCDERHEVIGKLSFFFCVAPLGCSE
jgi:hypothetical protein